MFLEISPPLCAEYSTTGGPVFSTVPNITPGGDYTPSSTWETPLRQFTLSWHSINATEYAEVYAWFLLMRGQNKGCRLKDPGDYQGASEFLAVGDASTYSFQLKRNYTSTVVGYDIVKADTGTNKITCKDADTALLAADKSFRISGSTGNDGYCVSSGAVTETYTADSYSSNVYTFSTADYTNEFEVNQKVVVSVAGTKYTRYVKTVTKPGADTLLELKTAVPAGGAADIIYGNTTITVTPDVVSAVADGTVDIYDTKDIVKPVESAAVTITVDGVAKTEDTDYWVDYSTGIITFSTAVANDQTPADNKRIVATAFEFDIPILLLTDDLNAIFEAHNYSSFSIPVSEWRSPD